MKLFKSTLIYEILAQHIQSPTMFLTTLLAILVTLLLKAAYDTISHYWFTPLRIKKIMERQGVRGPKPRFLTGNIPDMASLVSRAISQDMKPISHDIVGRLLPHFLAWSNQYGTYPHIYSYTDAHNSLYIYIYIY